MNGRAFLLIGLAACCGMLAAQETPAPPVVPQPGQLHIPPNTRVIRGTVRDSGGAPVPNAIVLLKDLKTLQVRSYLAQQDGTYHFYGLSTDVSYSLRAETNEMTSPSKQVSVFDSHKVIKLDLKIKSKKKNS